MQCVIICQADLGNLMRAFTGSVAAALQEEQVSSTTLKEQGTLQVASKKVPMIHVRI